MATAITFTQAYRAYCQAIAGRFIDHDPTGGGDLAYARTYNAYQRAFNETPDPAWWPPPNPELLNKARRSTMAGDAGSSVGCSADGHGGGHGCGSHGCGSGCGGH